MREPRRPHRPLSLMDWGVAVIIGILAIATIIALAKGQRQQ
jgi:hypothetical protein